MSVPNSRQTGVLVARENKRRVIHRIIEDVRTAYWKAVTATRLLASLSGLESRVQSALVDTRNVANRAQASPLTALTYERELVEIKREIQRLASDLSVAKTQLAALINVRPGTKFSVAMPGSQRAPRRLGMSVQDMIATALVSRSELRESAYNGRINALEAEAAILELLPGVSFEHAPNWNSNEFLFNNHWVTWGAKASWNLMKVFSYPTREAEINARDELLNARARAITMAIMTQVHVSRTRLIHARRRHRTAEHYYYVQSRILQQIRRSLAAGKVSEQTAIREEMNTLVARVKLDLAYVDLQSAFANVYASIGIDALDHEVTDDGTIADLTRALRTRWRSLGDRMALLAPAAPGDKRHGYPSTTRYALLPDTTRRWRA